MNTNSLPNFRTEICATGIHQYISNKECWRLAHTDLVVAAENADFFAGAGVDQILDQLPHPREVPGGVHDEQLVGPLGVVSRNHRHGLLQHFQAVPL